MSIELIKKDGFWSWFKQSKKNEIVVILSMIIAVLLVVQFAFQKPVAQEIVSPIAGFTQQLYATGDGNPDRPGWNFVVFPYSILLMQSDTHPETIFQSVIDVSDLQVHTLNSTMQFYDEWVYHSGSSYGGITSIKPWRIYYVLVGEDCTLSLPGAIQI